MRAVSILAFASLALSPMLTAESVAITPLHPQKGLEANGDAIEAIIRNEKLKTTLQKLNAPIVIRSMEEAAKHLTRASMEKIDVDFNTHKIVVFAWQGSGQDSLQGHLIRPGRKTHFEYLRGMTRDLRTHSAVYTMHKDNHVMVVDPNVKPAGQLGVHPLPRPPVIRPRCGNEQPKPIHPKAEPDCKIPAPPQKRAE